MEILERTHRELFWWVIASLIAATGYSAYWAVKRRAWSKTLRQGYWLLLFFFDIQLALGAALWIANEGWKRDTFIGVLHPVGMIAAAAIAHVAVIQASRSQSSKVFIGVGLSMLGALAIVAASAPRAAWP